MTSRTRQPAGDAPRHRTRALFVTDGLEAIAFGVVLFSRPDVGAVTLALLYGPVQPDLRQLADRHGRPGPPDRAYGIEVIDVAGEVDASTAPRLRDLLIELDSKDNYQLVVNLDRVEFLDSARVGVLVGAAKRIRAHDGSLGLVCTRPRILKVFRITGLTKVFAIHETVDQAIAAGKPGK